MSGRLKMAVFDLDGTLVDSLGHIARAMATAFTAADLAPPPVAAVRAIIGLPLATAVTHLAPPLPSARIETIVAAYKDSYHAQVVAAAGVEPLYEGARAALDALAAADCLLAVATGKGRRGLINVLEGHNLRDHFISLQSADDAPGKPHPAMLLQALNTAGVAPEDAVMIGDTSFDMEMARNAAVAAVAVTWGYHDRRRLAEHGPAAMIDDFRQLYPTVESLILR
ncbi:MAG: HAD-IA family hydrolase [Pseudomonadota bacterium]|nr:HAD-IA family hydrolase [Pseudomonadota bacterium]